MKSQLRIWPYVKHSIEDSDMFLQMERDRKSEEKNRRFWKMSRKRK